VSREENMSTAKSRVNGQSVLQHALNAAETRDELAKLLRVSEAELAAYLEGSATLPTGIFLRAIDVIART
jgi:hypothetical protein